MASDSDNSDAALAIAVISLIVATVAAVAGLLQLPWVRNLVCEKTSYLCEITYDLKVFKIGYYPEKPEYQRDPWNVLITRNVERKPSAQQTLDASLDDLFNDNDYSRSCIDDDQLRAFLKDMNAINKNDRVEIDFGGDYVPSSWVLYINPLQSNDTIEFMTKNDALMFYLTVSYSTAVRDVDVDINVTVGDGYRYYDEYRLHQNFKLQRDSTNGTLICRLFSPDIQELRFTFNFEDYSFNKTTKEVPINVDFRRD